MRQRFHPHYGEESGSDSWLLVIVAVLATFALMGLLPPYLCDRMLTERARMERARILANNQPN